MVRWAMRRTPTEIVRHQDGEYHGHLIRPGQFEIVDENLRHEFREQETRLIFHFDEGAKLTAFWPASDDPAPRGYFYLQLKSGWDIRSTAEVRRHFPEIGVIPMLTPIEQQEDLRDREYVRRNQDGRLSSRHFRNQLRLSADVEEYLSFVHEWTPEIELREPGPYGVAGGLDVFYIESGRRREKELVWAGDGIQVWLQVLFHILRLKHVPVLVLDEPDLYLHPDLQRRLVRVLESLPAQTITATHSPEILSEAPQTALIWVDKSRRSAVSSPDDAMLGQLSGAIGTQFNIRLAKALRARVVLFVEGDDMKIFRSLAQTCGAARLAKELDVAVVPLGGYSRADDVRPFRWLNEQFLKSSVQEWILLDRDYRSDIDARRVKREFASIGIHTHIWKRKELESYLLVPAAIARCCGADELWIAEQLGEIADGLRTVVQSRMGSTRQARERDQGRRERVLEEALRDFDASWAREERRLALCPAKTVITELNTRLQNEGHRAVSPRALAREMRLDEIADEVQGVIGEIEAEIVAGPTQ